MDDDGAAAWDDWYAADTEGRTIAHELSESKHDGMRRAFLAGRRAGTASSGWHYVIQVSPEGRPDPEAGPAGPMTAAEALARETGPDPLSGWRSVAVGPLAGGGGRTARLTLAWLMWCYEQGDGNPEDRAGMRNWMGDDPARMHPDDVKDRRVLLGMADEVLAALAAETKPAGG